MNYEVNFAHLQQCQLCSMQYSMHKASSQLAVVFIRHPDNVGMTTALYTQDVLLFSCCYSTQLCLMLYQKLDHTSHVIYTYHIRAST